jgi:ferredoxin
LLKEQHSCPRENFMKEVRMQAMVDSTKCAGCDTCIHVCPTMAYTQPKERPIERQILPPCNAECPVGNDIEGFVSLLQAEKWDDALHLLRTTNPLPGSLLTVLAIKKRSALLVQDLLVFPALII